MNYSNIPLDQVCADNLPATSWMCDNIVVFDCNQLLTEQQAHNLQHAIVHLDYIRNHIGGRGTNSPQRGVCVVGDRLLRDGAQPIAHTHWTASQNASNITLTTQTTPLPSEIVPVIDPLVTCLRHCFPDAPVSSSTFCLGVANKYMPGYKDTISAHTDDQPWYASPPVFASITYYPDGQPSDPKQCYRFQIFDITSQTWRFVHLPHNSICLMRADISHRVLPPLSSKGLTKTRINMTLRNLVGFDTNPLGFAMALANHYRYYGKPVRVILPQDLDYIPHIPLLKKYKALAKQVGTSNVFKIVKSSMTRDQWKQHHKQLREYIKHLYSYHKLDYQDIDNILSKTNVVLQTTQRAISWIESKSLVD